MTAVRALSGMLAVNRVLFGVGYLAAPERTAGSWIGRAAQKEGTKVFTRALGARDLALGAGALQALARQGADPRPWFAAHALADATDFAATLAARDRLPREGVRFALAMAGASTAIAVAGALSASGE
jgi:hypothetical protein